MINSVEQYLSELKAELSGSDPATIQDALADAEEHLRTAINGTADFEGQSSGQDALASAIEKYGTPAEIAAAYREIERFTLPSFVTPAHYREKQPPEPQEETEPETPVIGDTRPGYVRFFSIVIDPRAWAALLYLFFAFCTGIIYFTWVVTGFSLSVGLLVLIIGLPIAALFLITVWGISLAEGRLVEALLGVRMPRRPRYYRKNMGWWPRLRAMLGDKYTWLSLVYMVLQFPLGIFYFCFFITLIAASVWGVVMPILQLAFNVPIAQNNGELYYLYGWEMPILIIAGILLFFVTLHLAKIFGRWHGQLAKAMLVRT